MAKQNQSAQDLLYLFTGLRDSSKGRRFLAEKFREDYDEVLVLNAKWYDIKHTLMDFTIVQLASKLSRNYSFQSLLRVDSSFPPVVDYIDLVFVQYSHEFLSSMEDYDKATEFFKAGFNHASQFMFHPYR